MQILFKKILHNEITFETKLENICFYGKVQRQTRDLVLCKGKIEGVFPHICDRCGEEFELKIDEEIELFASDGIYEKEDSLDIIEFENGILDFDALLHSEIEAYKSDYHYCKNCSN